MAERSKVIAYNSELKEFLAEIWSYVPKGRQKQLLKNERIRALVERFGIPTEEGKK